MQIAFLSRTEINIKYLLQGLAPYRVTVCRSKEELLAAIPATEVLVVMNQGFPYHTVDARCLGAAKRLRLIQHLGVACDATEVETAARLKIPVATIPAHNSRSVAEHAFYLMLALARQERIAQRLVRDGRMGELECMELEGKTLCLVGLGAIGKTLVRMAKGFTMRVVGVRKSTATDDAYQAGVDLVYTARHLREALPVSDFVVLALPLTGETHDLIGAREFAAMKPGAMLVNVSRGHHVNREALEAALAQKRLGGFATDAYWAEPANPDDPLLLDERVIFTPHTGGKSIEAILRGVRGVRENIDRLERGESLLNVVNA